jgi:hypothetical protein
MVLRPKPPNPLTSSVLHTRLPPLDTCHRRPRPAVRQVLLSPARLAHPPYWLGQHGYSHVHLRSSMSQMSATVAGHPASWSLGQASRPSFTAPGPSARYVPTWPSPGRQPPPPSSTTAHHKARDMSHNPTHTMVSHQLNLGRGSRWQSLITKTNHKSTYQPFVCTQSSIT